ncbi:MAG: hypothetical protein RIS58_536 [Actinomycetota bacterium]|jgi:hypothetical protein
MERAREKRAIVHIGTHKTGSTSLQYWLAQNISELQTHHGLGVYRPIHPNGRELALLCANPDRSIPTIREIPEWRSEAWRSSAWGHVRSEVERTDEVIFFSNETLSLLRAPEELERLRDLLAPRAIDIVLVTRNSDDFLRSWRGQLTRGGFALSQDPTSFAYLEHDSWLIRYDQIVSVNEEVFGTGRVHVVDYDHARAEFGSVIPAIMARCGLEVSALPEWTHVHRNRGHRAHPNDSVSRFRKLLRRLRHT